jgi:hypothetical protein
VLPQSLGFSCVGRVENACRTSTDARRHTTTVRPALASLQSRGSKRPDVSAATDAMIARLLQRLWQERPTRWLLAATAVSGLLTAASLAASWNLGRNPVAGPPADSDAGSAYDRWQMTPPAPALAPGATLPATGQFQLGQPLGPLAEGGGQAVTVVPSAQRRQPATVTPQPPATEVVPGTSSGDPGIASEFAVLPGPAATPTAPPPVSPTRTQPPTTNTALLPTLLPPTRTPPPAPSATQPPILPLPTLPLPTLPLPTLAIPTVGLPRTPTSAPPSPTAPPPTRAPTTPPPTAVPPTAVPPTAVPPTSPPPTQPPPTSPPPTQPPATATTIVVVPTLPLPTLPLPLPTLPLPLPTLPLP